MNITPSIKTINIFFLPVLLLLVSCGEDHALKKEKYWFADETREWLPADTLGDVFLMRDNNGITISFVKNSEDYYFNKSWSSFLGVNTRMSLTEYRYLSYRTPFGQDFHISLTAGWPPYGDELYVSLNGIAFSWDFGYKTIHRLEAGDQYLSKLMTDEGYEEQEKIRSTVEFLDSLRTAGKAYHDVMHFTLLDFIKTGQPDPFRVKHIYLTKTWGLIRYDLANGIRYERVEE
jgi:hypothetical protein